MSDNSDISAETVELKCAGVIALRCLTLAVILLMIMSVNSLAGEIKGRFSLAEEDSAALKRLVGGDESRSHQNSDQILFVSDAPFHHLLQTLHEFPSNIYVHLVRFYF